MGGILNADHKSFTLAPSAYNPSLKSHHVGYTLRTTAELNQFFSTKVDKYTPQNYDVLTHNCNCFTEELVEFLCGHPIPSGITRLPEFVMQTPTARLLRPLLNRWLGGFSGGRDGQEKVADYDDPSCPKGHDVQDVSHETVVSELIGETMKKSSVPILVHYTTKAGVRVLATVTASTNEKGKEFLDLKWFSNEASSFETKQRVPRSEVAVWTPGETALTTEQASLASIQIAEADMSHRQEDCKQAKDLLETSKVKT